nr:ribonuclease H-like domain-containing protein [Tanacetum cinerariifolium]
NIVKSNSTTYEVRVSTLECFLAGDLPLVDGDVVEVGDLSLKSMEDEELATMDGVCKGAFGELGLEVEALVDTMEVYKAGKRLLYVKRNKAIFLGNVTSKVEFKFEGDKTLIVIQPPCYSASKFVAQKEDLQFVEKKWECCRFGKLVVEKSWEDLALYDNESWNDPRDFSKPVKAIALPQDVPSTSERRLIVLENQVQRLMEAHLAQMQPTQVNKVTTSCDICSGPYDTQYCMEDPEQAFVEYASSLTDEAGDVKEPLYFVDTSDVGIKSNLNDVGITAVHIDVNIALMKLVLLEVIENGATLPRTQVVDGVTIVLPITTAEEKAQRRLEVKARSTLMMGIPNEHQLKFNSIKDAKQLLEAVEKRFGGNTATKKTQRNLLKQQFENFFASTTEMLDQTFDRLQKLLSQLKLLEIAALIQQLILLNTANVVSTASTQVNVAFFMNIDNLSDAVICVFLASQPNSPQLVHEDLEQIHPDNIEEMDLRWQMAMLTMRARKFLKKTRRKLTVNGNETLGFDMSKVECYNCHKKGHFARECRASRNQDFKHKENTKRSVHVEIIASITLVSCDGLGGYEWSDQAEEGSNYTLMA